MSATLARIRKAIVAGIGAGAAVAAAAIQNHGQLSESDAIAIVGSVLVIGVLTYFVPNAAPAAAAAPLPLPGKSA